jgi:hypothetical protein
MRHDRTANLVIGRRRCGRKKALHIGNKGLFGERTIAGSAGWLAGNPLAKPLIFLG